MGPIKICIVGTHQSGSTRLFNLVRLLYEKKGKRVYSRWNINPKEIKKIRKEYDIILSKIHDTNIKYLDNYNVKLLPIRNILDAALSAGIRFENTSTEFYIQNCKKNINMFNKFKSTSDFIFRYENYNVYYIKKLCTTLKINLSNDDIISIMIELDTMLNSKNIAKKDNFKNKTYQKTLLSQNHNTSNGKTNKFINLSIEQLNDILKEKKISDFLKENFYF